MWSTINSKHNITPSQININPHAKDQDIRVPITQNSCPTFNKKLWDMLKGKGEK